MGHRPHAGAVRDDHPAAGGQQRRPPHQRPLPQRLDAERHDGDQHRRRHQPRRLAGDVHHAAGDRHRRGDRPGRPFRRRCQTAPANLDMPETYRLRISVPNNPGALNLTAIGPVTDTLPPGHRVQRRHPGGRLPARLRRHHAGDGHLDEPLHACRSQPNQNCDVSVNVTFPERDVPERHQRHQQLHRRRHAARRAGADLRARAGHPSGDHLRADPGRRLLPRTWRAARPTRRRSTRPSATT